MAPPLPQTSKETAALPGDVVNLMNVLEGDVLHHITPYLSIGDLSRVKLLSKPINDLLIPHNLFEAYGSTCFKYNDYSLRFDRERDDFESPISLEGRTVIALVQGGVVGQKGLGVGPTSRFKVCIPSTTLNVQIRAGLTRVRNDLSEFKLRSGYLDQIKVPPEYRKTNVRFRRAISDVIVVLYPRRDTITVETYYWNFQSNIRSTTNGRSMTYQRQQSKDYTLQFTHTSQGERSTCKVVCSDLGCMSEVRGVEDLPFAGAYTWFVEAGPTTTRMAPTGPVCTIGC